MARESTLGRLELLPPLDILVIEVAIALRNRF